MKVSRTNPPCFWPCPNRPRCGRGALAQVGFNLAWWIIVQEMLWHNVNLGFVYVKQVCFIYQHTAVYSKTPAPVVLIGDVSHYFKKNKRLKKTIPLVQDFWKIRSTVYTLSKDGQDLPCGTSLKLEIKGQTFSWWISVWYQKTITCNTKGVNSEHLSRPGLLGDGSKPMKSP